MLAMDVNDNACFLGERVAWTFFASMLAPTVVGAGCSVLGFSARAHRCRVRPPSVDSSGCRGS
ncbi:hypothetical protein DKY63_21645 [Pseudomonas putida]|uniref:Uncharacterized protein n=1 Tax=Pseudomonas putida TaxID=303 RepID=A0A2Z4RP04_PSEPU|nr:hypothetical protein DKY63_21645 [Pseudomonas putida]